jgi:GR25 family glycosyltransferase involved in LPS biosynthesis
MEDDWVYYEKKSYITDCLNVLNSNPQIGQCLINKNYTETHNDFDVVGGLLERAENGLRYYIHEYCPTHEDKIKFEKKYQSGKSSSYWPHFSFRPSLHRASVFKKVGSFNNTISHFEREYSDRYYNNGYISAFLEGIYCKHIGRLTSEKFDTTKNNAYTLNGEAQFTGKEEQIKNMENSKNNQIVKNIILSLFVINLDRRPDRFNKIKEFKELNIFKMTRYSAVDGSKLISTPQLQRIFDGNDYNMRSGMVGCAMSHIDLCVRLLKDNNSDIYCILEDDITLVDDYANKFISLIRKSVDIDWDIIYLGHHMKKQYMSPEYHDSKTYPIIEKWSTSKSLTMSLGGTTGYLISKKGAKNLLDFIDKYGMTNGIDTVQQKSADTLNVYYCKPHLVYSECWTGEKQIDTDIQFDHSSLTVSLDKRIEVEKEFYKDYTILTENSFQNVKNIIDVKLDKVVIYKDTPQNIENITKNCIHPYYKLENSVVVIVPKHIHNKKQRYIHRLMKNGKYDVSDAILYKK